MAAHSEEDVVLHPELASEATERGFPRLIVLGALDDRNEGLPEHTKTLDFVYRAFRDRGFAAEDIYYLRGSALTTSVRVLGEK